MLREDDRDGGRSMRSCCRLLRTGELPEIGLHPPRKPGGRAYLVTSLLALRPGVPLSSSKYAGECLQNWVHSVQADPADDGTRSSR